MIYCRQLVTLALLLWSSSTNHVCLSFQQTVAGSRRSRRFSTSLNFFKIEAFSGDDEKDKTKQRDAVLGSSKWPAVMEALDKVPVFACMDKNRKVVATENSAGDFVSLYYVSYDEAEDALSDIRDAMPKNADNIAVRWEGLGRAIQEVRKGEAVIIPSRRSLLDVGCTEEEADEPWSQDVPLFALLYAKGVPNDEQSSAKAGLPAGKSLVPMYMEERRARRVIAELIQGDPDARQIVAERVEKGGGSPAYDLLSLMGIVEELCNENPSDYFREHFPVIHAPADSYRIIKETMKSEAMAQLEKNPFAKVARSLGIDLVVDFGDGDEESLK